MAKNKYSIKKHFVVEKIDGNTTLFDVETSTFYSFNDTGSYIFSLVKKGTPEEKIASALIKKYEISESKAKRDVTDFLKSLVKNKIASSSEKK